MVYNDHCGELLEEIFDVCETIVVRIQLQVHTRINKHNFEVQGYLNMYNQSLICDSEMNNKTIQNSLLKYMMQTNCQLPFVLKVQCELTFYWHEKDLNFCNGSLPIATGMLYRQVYVAFSRRLESRLDPEIFG